MRSTFPRHGSGSKVQMSLQIGASERVPDLKWLPRIAATDASRST